MLVWRIRTRKVVIKGFNKQNSAANHFQTAPDRIRVASFNVAMFSWLFLYLNKMEVGGLKSILKNSPMHLGGSVNENHAKIVSTNLPENEISMAQT